MYYGMLQAMHASEWEDGIVWGSGSEEDAPPLQQLLSQEEDTELDQPQPPEHTHGHMNGRGSTAPWQPGSQTGAEGRPRAALGFCSGLPDLQARMAGRGIGSSVAGATSSPLGRAAHRLSLVDAARVEPLPGGKYPITPLLAAADV